MMDRNALKPWLAGGALALGLIAALATGEPPADRGPQSSLLLRAVEEEGAGPEMLRRAGLVFPSAQPVNRVFPFTELTDEDVSRLDLRDVWVQDWLDVLGEPSLTALDFQTRPELGSYDPSSFDFRLWMAWHDATNHLYLAVESVDDIHTKNENERLDRTRWSFFDDYDSAISFSVDGDRSGGPFEAFGMIEEVLLVEHVQAQTYHAIPGNFGSDSNVELSLISHYSTWFHLPPYADGGGGSVGEHPTSSVVEFYVTAFDRLIWNSQEESVVSELYPGKFIRFGIALIDLEPTSPSNNIKSIFSLSLPTSSSDADDSKYWADGLLVGADSGLEDTATSGVTWGRIKASIFDFDE